MKEKRLRHYDRAFYFYFAKIARSFMKGVIIIVLVYVISFIVGGFISFMLYDKVPVIVSLIIATMVGSLIGYIYNRIQRKKAEQEYVEWMKRAGFINLGE